MKSRSLTASRLFGWPRRSPGRRPARRDRSGTDSRPARPRPAATHRRAAEIGQARAVALPGPGVAQQPVAPAHRLRRLQVGVAGHQDVDLGLGALDGGADEAQPGRRPAHRSATSATAARRWPPDRCGCGRCAACRPPGRSARSAGARRSCGCPRRSRRRMPRPDRRAISARSASSPATIWSRSPAVSSPGAGDRPRPGDGAGDVGVPQPPVERQRRVETGHAADRSGR